MFRAPASYRKQTLCNMHAAITLHFAASCGKPAWIYAHGNITWQHNMATQHGNIHAAIPMRSAATDSKTPYNYARTNTPKAWSHR